MKKAVVISILLHILLFTGLTIPYVSSSTPHTASSGGSIQVELMPIQEAGGSEIITSVGTGEVPPPGTTSKCVDKTYNGIGILYSVSTWTILDAPETYPAYIAGIRIGDQLTDPPSISLIPDSSGDYDFYVRRDGKPIHFHIGSDKICFKDE